MEHAAGIIAVAGASLTAVTLAIGRLIKWDNESKRAALPSDPTQRALALLQERYASGEIDRDEFLERRGYLELSAERLKELGR